MSAFPSSVLRPRDRRGFALLITITLLAFLVLLLVSLASLTRVETQVAANNQQLSQARQNALMGLNVAIGRLQALAGPDQRVTGTADLIATRDATKRNWTGVWQGAYTVPATPTQLGWLVSGTKDASGAYQTGSAVVAGSIPSDNTVVTMVGSNSTDTGDSANAVIVVKEAIKSSSVAGLSGEQTIGNYAYWVGDEGVKARVDVVDPYATSADAVKKRYSLINAGRNGIERVDTAVDRTSTASPLGATAYPANNGELAKIIDWKQFPLSNTASSAELTTVSKRRFHDLTTYSRSIPADVARGGLKRDLTAWLAATPAGATETDSTLIYDPSADGGGGTYGLPKWGIIRDYWNIKADGTAKTSAAQTDTVNGVHPVITFSQMGFDVSSPDTSPANQFLVHLFPVLVIWNPYNVPIAAETYEVDYAADGVEQRIKWKTTTTNRFLATLNLANTSLDAGDSNSNTRFKYWRFRVACPEIPAGASLVFRPGSSGTYSEGISELAHSVTDSGYSFTMSPAGVTLTDAERDEGVLWVYPTNWWGFPGHAVLRKAGVAYSAPASFNTELPGALHTAQFMPTTNSTPTPTNQVTTLTSNIALNARTNLGYYTRMSRENIGAKPRWIAQQNYRSPRSLFLRSLEGGSSILFGGYTSINNVISLSFGAGGYASAGSRVDSGRRLDLALARFLPESTPLFSLAQLQHAGLSLIHANPTYAVGNSMADPLIDLDKTRVTYTAPDTVHMDSNITTVYDLPYLLNRELWDRYFFSTIPSTLAAADLADTAYTLPNSRMDFHRDGSSFGLDELNGANAFRRSAAHLFIKGGFNVNSTSFQAWRALLSAHRDLAAAGTHLINRDAKYDSTALSNDLWAGQRTLTDAQIDRLAWNIVQQVKTRGPFVSLADFVNRRLGTDKTVIAAYKGAIQAAIDATDTETVSTGPVAARINTSASVDDRDTGKDFLGDAGNYQANAPGSSSYDVQRSQGGPTAQMPYSSRSAYAPGYLSQADVLGMIGAELTARSDTFVVRSYGEYINPVTGTVDGKAWCEAVVQRMPEYMTPSATQQPWDAAAGDNATFGRRFKIVRLTWLSPTDI